MAFGTGFYFNNLYLYSTSINVLYPYTHVLVSYIRYYQAREIQPDVCMGLVLPIRKKPKNQKPVLVLQLCLI